MTSVRELAFLSLYKCETAGKYSNLETDSTIEKYGLSGSDRAFFTRLVYGVIEKKLTLDYIISRFSAKNPEKLDTDILILLR